MQILIQHTTTYDYERPVYLTPHILRLKPAAHSRTAVEKFSLYIEPENHIIHWQQDPFGNFLARVDIHAPATRLQIDVKITVNINPVNPFDFFLDAGAAYFPFEYEPQLKQDLCPYMTVQDKGPGLMQWVDHVDRSKQETVAFLIMLNKKVFQTIAYTERMEPGVQSSETSLSLGSGSCRDSGWLLVQIARHMGLAARFVSGYLIQLTDHNNPGELLQDTAALHAWAEVYIPGAGWIGLDPTSGLFAGEGHIPLACTSYPDSAAPITGTSEINKTVFTYSNSVTRLSHEITV